MGKGADRLKDWHGLDPSPREAEWASRSGKTATGIFMSMRLAQSVVNSTKVLASTRGAHLQDGTDLALRSRAPRTSRMIGRLHHRQAMRPTCTSDALLGVKIVVMLWKRSLSRAVGCPSSRGSLGGPRFAISYLPAGPLIRGFGRPLIRVPPGPFPALPKRAPRRLCPPGPRCLSG